MSGFRDGSLAILIGLSGKASLKRSYLSHANIWCKNILGRENSSSVFGACKGWRRLTKNEIGEVAMDQIMWASNHGTDHRFYYKVHIKLLLDFEQGDDLISFTFYMHRSSCAVTLGRNSGNRGSFVSLVNYTHRVYVDSPLAVFWFLTFRCPNSVLACKFSFSISETMFNLYTPLPIFLYLIIPIFS